jgi:hypothetical protein
MRRGLQTDDYLMNTNEGNPFGKGFELVSQTNALGDTRTRLEVDELFVRIKAFFASLEIREISYVGGNYIFSAAGSKIYYVEWLDANGNILSKTGSAISSVYKFRCYLYSDNGSTATINKWAVDDQIMCRTFNIDSGVHQNVSNKYYWRRAMSIGKEIIKTRSLAAIEKQYLADVEAVNEWQVMTQAEQTAQAQALADLLTAKNAAIAAVNAGNTPEGGADVEAFTQYNYVDISMADCDGGSDYPEDEDTIVQFGNWSNAARQGIIFLQVEGAGSPAIMEYAKVGADGRHFVLPDPTLLLSPTKNVIYGEFHSVVDSQSGNTGSGDTIDDQLRALIDRLNDIQNQADKKFEMWFGTYVPLPNIIFTEVASSVLEGSNPATMGWYEVTGDKVYETTEDTSPVNGKHYYIKTDNNGTPNSPASEWDTDEKKALHAQDLFYDTMREPASYGGRAWRWEALSVDGTVIYRWIETFDKDTIDALEKISDVATDNRLTGGAEKTRVYIDWMKAVQDYAKYVAQAIDYGLNDNVYWGENENIFVAYDTAFKKLARLLNGDDTTSESLYVSADIINGTVAPAWLADLSTTTDIPSPTIYRQVWNTYYAALAALLKAIQKRAKELADQAQTSANEALNRIDGIAADGVLSTTEIPALKREFETAYRQREEMADLATDDTTHKLIDTTLFAPLNTYLAAFKTLANYLNRQGGANGESTYGAWTEPTGGTYNVSNSGTAANATYDIVAKSQLADADFPNLLGIDADVKFQANWASPTTDGDGGKKFRDLWADLERQRVALANAMATLTKETADGAQEAVDDLADDKILSAGSEKSKLLLEWLDVMSAYTNYTAQAVDHLQWLGTTGDEGTVRTALGAAKDMFVTKVKALGTFLNAGNAWNIEYNAAEKPLPLYLGDDSSDGFAHDTNLTGHGQTAAGYRTCWSQYYDAYITLLKWLTQAGKIKTEHAQADATEALNLIDGIAADGVLSTTEIPDLKREFETAYRQREEMADLATDDTTHKLIDSVLRVPLDDYLSKFIALANYLNQGSAWTEPTGGTYSVSNGSGVTDANATYNIAAKSPLTDADFPSLMRITSDVDFVADWIANPQVADNGAAFRNLWAALATAQVTLANAMATLAKNNADEANDRVDDIVSDGIISAGSEKSLLYLQWLKTVAEYKKYIEQAGDYFGDTNTQDDALVAAYKKVAVMLNNGNPNDASATISNDILNGTTRPSWLTAANLNVDTVLANTPTANSATYHSVWNGYQTALTSLLEVITKKAKELADAAQADATTALSKIGDMGNDGKLDPSEKLTVKREFIAVWDEKDKSGGILDMCLDDEDHFIISQNDYITPYINAFVALGTYLNGGTSWNAGSSTQNATYRATDANLPSWIQDANMSATNDISGSTWRTRWSTFYSARTAVLTALSDLAKQKAEDAQETADDAQDKIADIVSDGIISGGSEKTQLYKEWVRTKGEYFDYYARSTNYGFKTFNNKPIASKEYGYYQDDLAFEQAFDALVLMMNGGTYGGGQSEVNKDYTNRDVKLYSGNELEWLYNLQADTVIGNYSYTDNGSSVAYTATKYRQLWNTYYYASVKLLNDFTEYSKALADEALNKLDEIASDGKITPSEKNTILLNWREVVTEYPIIKSQADTYTNALASGDLKTSLQGAASAYILAFNTLATLLNDGTTYSYTFSPANFPTPSWIGTNFDRTEELTEQQKTAFNSAWDGYYNTRTALQDIFVDVAKKSGDDALGELSNLAADDVLTEFEKLTVLREWDSVYKEFSDLVQKATNAHVSSTAYQNAYYSLGNYLYDKNSTSTDRHINFNFAAQDGSMITSTGNSEISGSTFKTLWGNYYKERSALLGALSAKKVNYFVGSSVPATPYFVGDLWLKTSTSSPTQAEAEAGQMFICIAGRTTEAADSVKIADWADMKEVTEKRDPRILIAALVNMVYSYNGGFVRELSTNSYQSISLGESGTLKQGNLRYYDNKVWQYSDMWEEIVNETLRESFKTLHEVIGNCTLRIFRQFPTITKQIYDIVCAPVTFTDSNAPSGYQTVEGGLTIHMYNGSDWEVLQESQQSLIQNLSGYVRAVAYKRAGEYSTAAGFITSTDWATLFAQAETDGRVVARSEISAFITKVSDGNGGYVMESGVRISANNIDLTGTDSISLAIQGISSSQRQYAPNLLPNSIINETSNAYGFGVRSLKLENGKTYTLSASGIIPNDLENYQNMVLAVFIYRLKDSQDTNDTSQIGKEWAEGSVNVQIAYNSAKREVAQVASVSFTANRTGTYYISSYLYNKTQGQSGNSGTRTYPVTTLWYKVEEGSTATPWVANDNDERHVDNYIMNPLAVSATKEVNSDFSSSEVTNNEYGKVLQVSHNVNGHWQLSFTRRSTYAQLTNNHATFYVICKSLDGFEAYTTDGNGDDVRTRLCFGHDNNGTQVVVDTRESAFIDLGNGWRKYYAVKKMDLALGSTVGICHVLGSWQIYAVGIVAGSVCPTMAEIMASNSLLKTGIDLTAGKIDLRADKVTFTSSDGTVTNKISINPTTGTLNATDANISGTVNATAGNIGGFTIASNSISTESTGSLQIGGSSFNTKFGIVSTNKSIMVNDAINGISFNSRSLPYKENNRLTLVNSNQSDYYNWENVTVANVMNMDYFSGIYATSRSQNTYGFQFAMLGSGHIGMDGIVEGGCLDNLEFSADNQVMMVRPPLFANRINIKTASNNDILILPDKYSIFSTLGCGVINSKTSQKFSFRIDIINTTNKNVYIGGRGSETVGNTSMDNAALPYLYYWKQTTEYDNGTESWINRLTKERATSIKELVIKSFSVLSFMLIFDGTNFYAIQINTDKLPLFQVR